MTEEESAVYQSYYEEALSAPMDYVVHDTNASFDDKLREAAADGGWEFYGRWWRLVELLTAKDGHCYDVSTERGWRFLACDMGNFCPVSVAECKDLVDTLLEYGLLDRVSYEEHKHVVSRRVIRNADGYAKKVAKARLGSWKTNSRKRSSSGGSDDAGRGAERDAER